ncbi:thiol reductant ABC exporter subunit CydC [Salipaludibacillus neizhouensis]|uniref:Thiol reductant ABC exporter subunit CydC n=1 Tax=Salipaludibacillus neizhouensis TaxID=885475 RepID=A0A3A9KBY9_9BACI|nr:thiol reductant ABC exporter subunit CydC [Salipaludibacillus neizhouensis]RKL67133.1 thiol reductant ABC exporter subunit CydC [Salipaludibacillus neizhouensis]
MKELGIVVKLVMKEKKDVFYSILFGFLAGMATVSLFANSGYLISKAAVTPPLYVLTVSIALLKLFSVTRALTRYAERYYSHRATFTILSNLRVHFFERLEPLVPGIFQKYRSGDLLSRIVGDVESLQNFFLRVYYPPIVMIIVFLSTIAFTMYFSVEVAIVLILGLILTGVIVPGWFAWKRKNIESKLRVQRGELSTETTEFLYGFLDLKIHQKQKEKEQQLTNASNSYIEEQERDGVRGLFNHSVNQMVSLTVSWFILVIGGYLVSAGQLDGVFLAMLVMISLTVFENSTPMAVFPSHYEDSRLAASRLFSVVGGQKQDTNKSSEKPKELKQLDNRDAWTIEMENVSFAFPDEKRLALDNVSLNFPAGSKTAIVGPSGSGKSTLLQLLLKVYEASKGNVRLQGESIDQIENKSVWKGTNIVLQHNHFFYGTIRDNLLIAGDELTDEAMLQALGKVQLGKFALDDRVLEHGQNLSGGEKQRLAIARVILKGSRLWLLDEPTSSVDALTESIIFQHLLEQAKEDTLILISHRLTGLEQMDRIIVMEHGKMIESGTFSELMDKKGYFYEMKQIEKSVFT